MPLHNCRVTWILLTLGTANFLGGNTPKYTVISGLGIWVQPWGKVVSSNSGWVFDIQSKSPRAELGGPVQQTFATSQKGSSRCSSLELLKSKQGSRGVLELEQMPALLSWLHQTVLRS